MKHAPRKRFGQHFLTDASVLGRIGDAIDPRNDDRLVEIGPGLGALTVELLDRIGHLDAVEIDRDLVARLRKTWGSRVFSDAEVKEMRKAEGLNVLPAYH